MGTFWKSVERANKIYSSGYLLGSFWKGMAKFYQVHLLGHLLDSFWKGMAKFYQVHLLGHLLGSFWKGMAKTYKAWLSGHIFPYSQNQNSSSYLMILYIRGQFKFDFGQISRYMEKIGNVRKINISLQQKTILEFQLQ